MQAASQPCRQLRASNRLSRRRSRAAGAQTAPTASQPPPPIVILPGLGNAAEDYEPLSAALAARFPGCVVRTARVARPDWLRNAAGVVDAAYWQGTLNPSPTVDWYLQRMDEAVADAKAASGSPTVSFLAHSAGGWLARVWLQRRGCAGVARVVSLGSPLRPPPRGVAGVVDQTRGILTYVDANCPGAPELAAAGGRWVAVAGRYLQGVSSFSPAQLNAFVVGAGYFQVCGDAAVWGDGITPTDWALLPGAEPLVLDGVYHSPLGAGPGRPWYGSEGVLEKWADALLPVAQAA